MRTSASGEMTECGRSFQTRWKHLLEPAVHLLYPWNSKEVLEGGHILPPQLIHEMVVLAEFRTSQVPVPAENSEPGHSPLRLFSSSHWSSRLFCSMSWTRAMAAFASCKSIHPHFPWASETTNDLRSRRMRINVPDGICYR